MANNQTVTAEYKVGTNKGRPRIWLDGKRLIEAGFTGGTKYQCFVGKGEIVCFLGVLTSARGADSVRERKVTGRPDGKPIIDILGRDVETALPGAQRVTVKFETGKLTIRAAEVQS